MQDHLLTNESCKGQNGGNKRIFEFVEIYTVGSPDDSTVAICVRWGKVSNRGAYLQPLRLEESLL